MSIPADSDVLLASPVRSSLVDFDSRRAALVSNDMETPK